MNFSIVEGQLARWLEFLASYDFEIQFRKGISHKNADRAGVHVMTSIEGTVKE